MKDTLEYILRQIVEHPEEISVDQEQEDSRYILSVHAHESDYGKIIGKNGRIIRALRDLIKLMAAKQNVYVDVTVAE